MTLRVMLRAVAILIAVAAVVDPAWSIGRPGAQRVVAVDLVDGDGASPIASLQAALPGWEVVRREGTGSQVPCAPDERCVLIADGTIAAIPPRDLRAAPALLTVRNLVAPDVTIESAFSATAHVAAAGALKVVFRRHGDIAQTAVVVRDGTAVVGSATHTWGSADSAVVDVLWWPLDAAARTLRIEATPVAGETHTVDNVLDLGVPIRTGRVPVLVFDARPSWSSTFVRRALEADARLQVEHRSRLAPSLSTGTRGAVLDAVTLASTPVVVVGDPGSLTGEDVALLDRYARIRGGSIIFLPERRVAGPALRLFPGEWSERLVPAPDRVGPLQAGELLQATRLPLAATVVASAGETPVVVSTPLGNGRVIVSGAMDAWRYRAKAFDEFWRSLVLEAGQAGAALQIAPDALLAVPSARLPISVSVRSFEAPRAADVTVTVRCGDAPPVAVRVWPDGSAGSFVGEVAVSDAACEIRASDGDHVATAQVAVTARPLLGVDATLARLERAVKTRGGATADVGAVVSLAQQLTSNHTPTSQVVSVRPMHSPWWLLPFAGCLTVEWWLRRRGGLR
ncbi:MAG: hypothetical protein RLZZ53_610 [Acidobacteriota bacterium]